MEAGICQPADASVPASLADHAPEILRAYFDEYANTFLTNHHIQSYEAFVFRELPEIIQAENPITVLKEPLDAAEGIYKYKTEIYVGGIATNPSELALDVGAPTITLDGGATVRRMFPNEARLRNLTYAVTFQADITVKLTFTSRNTSTEVGAPKYVTSTNEMKFPKYSLFRIPILLRSKLCATYGASKTLLAEMGECRNDQGGYFIVDGSEKLLITRQEQAYNSLYVGKIPDENVSMSAKVICQHPVTKQTRTVALYRMTGKQNIEEGAIRISIPFVKGTVPLFAVFRALGVESDEEIVRMILPDIHNPVTSAMEMTLIPSIHDAWPITNRVQAIGFLHTLTKGFIIADVLNILHTHLFSHVPDRPLARAQYLAEIVRNMIRTEMRMQPPTNRDDIRNQRLLSTGTLLRGLFSDCWKDWKKAVRLQVDKKYNYNKSLYSDENFLNIFSSIGDVLNPGVLNKSIMSGFRGRWGTNPNNMKKGVIQPVARISFMDAMSHTRRVISDFDTSMKLTGPRHLHPSQVGYFCTAETPTGGHIGATKNMSILTAVSVAAPPLALTEWLFGRAGVIDVSAATPLIAATATSVQINGGTIGFTTRPDILTGVLKLMKWTACMPPTSSIAFNTAENTLRIYLDDGRPLRPLWHLDAGGEWPAAFRAVLEGKQPPARWRDMVCGTLPATASLGIYSVAFVDPLASVPTATLEEYGAALTPHIGSIEYIDPYEGNEAYVSWYGNAADLKARPETTHAEVHPSSLMGVMASMIPFANHNQSPRNQLSCSQSKQAIGYYASNYESRFDTYGSMLCYGEGALARTIVHDAVAGGSMPYGTNIIFCINSFNGYNQDDGILFNRSSIQRGLFRSLAFRSYETVEEVDQITDAVYRIGNPRNVLAWSDLKPGYDYSALDEQGIIKEGTVIHEKTVLVGRYFTDVNTHKLYDASMLPTVFTKGRVDKVVVLHQNNNMRLVRVRILEERVPELGDKFCLTPDHDVLTSNRGWVPIADVTTSDTVYCLEPSTHALTLANPSELHTFDCVNESLYNLESQQVDLMTTMNHKMYVQTRYSDAYELLEAKDIMGKRVRYKKDAANTNTEYSFILPAVGTSATRVMPMTSWLEFLGLWISDGWIAEGKARRGRTESELRIEISAVVEAHRAQLIAVAEKLGLHPVSNEKNTKLFFYDKQMATYLQTLSVGAINKRLPDWVWECSEAQCRILLNGLVDGDGYRSKSGNIVYYTSSLGLCGDVQRLALHAGYSANVRMREPAGHEFMIRGKTVKTNADGWAVHIVRTKNRPTVNHGHIGTQSGQSETVVTYTGKVHCITVPSHIFYVRRNGKPVWTGNSSRHGQKGTIGMMLDAQDMPRTADGMVPDVIVNPHCIPSRMTIAQILEQVFGKLGAIVGAKMNATPFMNDEQSFKAIGDALQALGFQREGEEIMYSGMTGKMFTSSVFIGPLHFMRLKHLTQDKMNSRSAGRKEIRTHQPTGGRGNEGGMRIGEMERDSLIAHGVTDFLSESMMRRSDGAVFWICNGCGTVPIYNESHGLFVCPLCDGPLTYQGNTVDTLGLVLPVKKSRTTFSRISAPYALKLLDQELTTFMNAGLRFLTEKNIRTFREHDLLAIKDAEEEPPLAAVLEEKLEEVEAQAAVAADLPVPEGMDAGAEDAPADLEDEGQPERNVVEPAPVPDGVQVIEFYSKIPLYKEFSNFFPVKLSLEGKTWPTVEHYFQAMKFPENPDYQETIRAAKTPTQAKRLGKTRAIPIRPDWNTYRDEVMLTAIREKFSLNHAELRQKLLNTGNAILKEASPMDNYWGIGRKKNGKNKLGEILMKVRAEIATAPGAAADAGLDAMMTRPAAEASAEAAAAAAVTASSEVPSVNVIVQAAPAAASAAPAPAPGAPAPEMTNAPPALAPVPVDPDVKVINIGLEPPAPVPAPASAVAANSVAASAVAASAVPSGPPVLNIQEIDANAVLNELAPQSGGAAPANLPSAPAAPAAPAAPQAPAALAAPEENVKILTVNAPLVKK